MCTGFSRVAGILLELGPPCALDLSMVLVCLASRVCVLHVVNQLEKKERELESQFRINAAQAGEIDAQAAEIELRRTEVFDLKR